MPALTPQELDFLRQHNIEAVCLVAEDVQSSSALLSKAITQQGQIIITPPQVFYLDDFFRCEKVAFIGQIENDTLISICQLPLQELWVDTAALQGAVPTEIGQLTQLVALRLAPAGQLFGDWYEGHISLLPAEIGQLVRLKYLDVGENELTTLPAELSHLTQLRELYVGDNQLTVLPSELGQLTQLLSLHMGENQLAALPPELGQLTQLQKLYVDDNELTTLPANIRQLTQLHRLDLRSNPLPIPAEILNKTDNPAAILAYYFERSRPLNQVKLLVVGQGSVGKTSLIERLLHDRYIPGQLKTEGIAVSAWEVQDEQSPEKIRLNLWDFGGQEIMHATHQFFLTKRSLYLLVVDARLTQEENRIEYWLKIIQSFGGDSPVLLVGNKTDQHPLDIDRTGLQKKYSNLVGFVETSAATGQGLDNLRAAITQRVNILPHVHDLFPEKWWTVKTKLETWQRGGRNFLTREGYVALCDAEGITDALKQHTLIGFLHDLGNVLYFQDDDRLAALGILRPQWVTDAVYKILNSHAVFVNKGVLTLATLHQLLDLPDYPREKHLFLVDLMRKFELCYDLTPDSEFLIPDLLPKDEPYTGDWSDALGFDYFYNVLPGSVISRFIVRMHAHIHAQPTLWRAGVVLQIGPNPALVKADTEDRRIRIRVGGPTPTRREALGAIRLQLAAIHKTIIKLEATPQVPHPTYPALLIDHEKLLQFERDGITTFPESVSGRTINVNARDLLDGVDSARQRGPVVELPPIPTALPIPPAPVASVSTTTPAPVAAVPVALSFQQRLWRALQRVLVWPKHLGRLAFDLLKNDKASESSTLLLGYGILGVLLVLLAGLVGYLDVVRLFMAGWRFFVP